MKGGEGRGVEGKGRREEREDDCYFKLFRPWWAYIGLYKSPVT